MTNEHRPECPACHREMIFVAIASPGRGWVLKSWMCDCDYRRDPEHSPDGIIPDLVRSREWDEAALTLTIPNNPRPADA